jgi:Lipase (class 3)
MSILVELPLDQYNRHAFANFSADAGFNQGNALAMAWMSQLAYETGQPDKIPQIADRLQLDRVDIVREPAKSTLPMSDTRGVIASKGDALLIAFAGTDPLNLLNWVSNFSPGRLSADAHEGFVDAAAAVWERVGAAIEQGVKDRRRLFVTGHSLGAAIALATLDHALSVKLIDKTRGDDAQVFVFGAPRVGRKDFVTRYDEAFGETTYRLVHGKDIVPTVPPSELGFHHVGRFLRCESGAKFDVMQLSAGFDSDEPVSGEDLISGVLDRVRNLFGLPSSTSRPDLLGRATVALPPSIGDHLPDRYYTALTPSISV